MSRPKLDVRILALALPALISLFLHHERLSLNCNARSLEIVHSEAIDENSLCDDLLARYRSEAEKWSDEVAALERLNAEAPIDPSSVLFVGSSSIRLWESIKEDMLPIPAIRRGFGGAKLSDLAVHLCKIVPTAPVRSVVVFVANDIRGETDDKSPDEIVQIFSNVVEQLRELQPQARIYLLAITPTRARWSVWPQIQLANRELQSFCEKIDGVEFIPTEDIFLNTDSQPREEYFQADRLHLNREGYRVWSRRIRESLEKLDAAQTAKRKAG